MIRCNRNINTTRNTKLIIEHDNMNKYIKIIIVRLVSVVLLFSGMIIQRVITVNNQNIVDQHETQEDIVEEVTLLYKLYNITHEEFITMNVMNGEDLIIHNVYIKEVSVYSNYDVYYLNFIAHYAISYEEYLEYIQIKD